MATRNEQKDAARGKAAELALHRQRQETERLANREKESRAQDEKMARLRGLRLAKEALDLATKNAPSPKASEGTQHGRKRSGGRNPLRGSDGAYENNG